MDVMALRSRRWSRTEYEQLVERGSFGPDDHLELLDGLLIAREPQGSRHAAAVAAARLVLTAAFGPGYHVRDQAPIALDETSEPEPDLAVVRGAPWDYQHGHPSTPILVVEIADSRLALDRKGKGRLYARAGLADYWIVNLMDEVLEVLRDPGRSPSPGRGFTYRSVRILSREESISPIGAPRARVSASALLPPRYGSLAGETSSLACRRYRGNP